MSTATRPSARERADALARLRRLTLYLAAGGLAATAGFGLLAAATFAGQPRSTTGSKTPPSIDAPGDASNGAGTVPAAPFGGSNGGLGRLGGQGVTPPAFGGSGGGHVSTGGSR
jgi:hypothetical protein